MESANKLRIAELYEDAEEYVVSKKFKNGFARQEETLISGTGLAAKEHDAEAYSSVARYEYRDEDHRGLKIEPTLCVSIDNSPWWPVENIVRIANEEQIEVE